MKKILFIGNSYTYYNQLWDRVAECAAAAGEEVTVAEITCGGYHLRQMCDPQNEYGAKVKKALEKPYFDTVVLQENSLGTLRDREGFAQSVSHLAEMARAVGAQPILYQTWARKEGNAKLTELGMTVEEMTRAIASVYREVGKALDIPVSPVGTAFYRVISAHPEIELYDPDGSHPSPLGTSLASLCLFGTIFPDKEIPHFELCEDEAVAEAFREAATQARSL